MKKLQAFWSDFQLPIVIFLGIILLLLGYVGFIEYGIENGESRTVFDNIYQTIGLMTMETGSVSGKVNWKLEVARFLTPIIAAYTAILAFAAIFQQQAQLVRLWFIQNHIVIYALGDIGSRLAKKYLANQEKVVIIDPDGANEEINSLRSAGAIIINSDLKTNWVFLKARIHRAKTIFLVSQDDSDNAEGIFNIEEFLADHSNHHLNCVVHISDAQLWRLLRDRELNHSNQSNIRLELFNIYNHGASLMLRQYLIDQNNPILMVIGHGQFSETIITQACLQWREVFTRSKTKLELYLIDGDAVEQINTILAKHPDLTTVCDLSAVEADVDSAKFLQGAALYKQNQFIIPDKIVICLEDATRSFSTALFLNEKYQNHATSIILQTTEDTGLAHLVKASDEITSTHSPIILFPLLDKTCTPEILLRGTHEIIARELHETYLDSQEQQPLPHWEELPDSVKEVNRRQAERISQNLLQHGYRILPLTHWLAADHQFSEAEDQDEVEAMAKFEHDLWCECLKQDGWTYGAKRSNEHKTHPDLISWENLPISEMEKNKTFIRSIPKILSRVGFEVQKYQ